MLEYGYNNCAVFIYLNDIPSSGNSVFDILDTCLLELLDVSDFLSHPESLALLVNALGSLKIKC
jgi:hypothetical protein